MSITVCIPTRNRPGDLAECLDSIAASSVAVGETIVADDSTDGATRTLTTTRYPHVTYVDGLRQGLGPNRNRALDAATGEWILFLDDDARLGVDFLATLAPFIAADDRRRTIFTGIERQTTALVFPNDQNFLGFQTVPYKPGAPLNTLVINAALFPAALFRTIRFDPQLVYGYDEVDVAMRARLSGYEIRLCPEAVNRHFPSQINRGFYGRHTEIARIYVTFKRYAEVERRPFKAVAFIVASFVHSVAHHLKTGGVSGVAEAMRTHRAAWRKIALWRASRRSLATAKIPGSIVAPPGPELG